MFVLIKPVLSVIMENLKHEIDDESCTGSDDLVEYTLEEQEEYQDDANPSSMDELEELVEISSMPDDQVDEEMCDETYDVKEESYERPAVKVADVRTQGTMFKGSIVWNNTNTLDGKYKNKIVVQPHSSISGGTMKLLNSTQPTLQSTASTTSYRLVNTDGTMIMNVASSQPPQTVKKIISISKPNIIQQANTSKVTLNQNARVLQIQPQNSSPASGTVKTVTIAKNALTMKAVPAGTIKTLPQTALPGTSSTIQKPLVHLTKAAGQGVTIAPHRIINNTSSQGDSEDATIVIKPSNAILPKKLSTSNIQPRYVPGMKGVQYVRVLNQRAPVGSGTTPNMIFQTLNKTPAANSPVSTTIGSGSASAGTSKIVLQNNRTYVVRSGIGAVGTSTPPVSGKPTVLPTTRKIILGGTNAQSLDQNNPPTRIIIKKEVVDPKRLVIAKQSQTSNNIISIVKGGNIKIEPSKQQQLPDQNEASSAAQATALDDKMVDVDIETTRKNTSYGFPEEAYKKRPCHCTKSQCLKLYCDCFANGEFCYNCNCKDCYNTFDHEAEREKAVRCTLERNPNAFKPKIVTDGTADDGTRLHTKGCNCKRSGCLKNYCECYEAKIPCSSNCKCVGCRNTDQFAQEFNYFGHPETSTKTFEDSAKLSGKNKIIYSNANNSVTSESSRGLKRSASFIEDDISELPEGKHPHNFMTLDVIEATVQCMVAQADECLKRGCSIRTSERMILEEYGRCLLEIKDFALKTEN